MVDQKMSLNKFKKTEIISSIFSHHNTTRLQINYKEKKNCKKHKNLEANNTLTINGSLKKSKRKDLNGSVILLLSLTYYFCYDKY